MIIHNKLTFPNKSFIDGANSVVLLQEWLNTISFSNAGVVKTIYTLNGEIKYIRDNCKHKIDSLQPHIYELAIIREHYKNKCCYKGEQKKNFD